ncbi:MAG: site-2 protease family protein [Desulfobacteraceae bacterium]|nr:MAG: site-2 protease family protein [Desulfobacteraceae bacterium]
MFGKRLKLFRLAGFEVGADLSWVIIAVLIAWSLSMGYFPYRFENLSPRAYWIMGITGALGLFLSIIIHEFAHSLAARKMGMPMKGITLFIFGGIAEMGDEPPNAKAEFLMAISGPLASIALALGFYALYTGSTAAGAPLSFSGVIGYLAFINLVLAIFNLIPAYPLDGGRVLRALLWHLKKNMRWATRISAGIGSGFGIFLIILGVVRVLYGNFIGGMWFFLIGMFLNGAAKASYQQLVARKALEGEPLQRFMNTEPVTVAPSLPLDRLVEDYVYKYHYKLYPVVEDQKLVGCVNFRDIRSVEKERWSSTPVKTLMQPCSLENTIAPQADAVQALSQMNKSATSRLMVVDQGRLTGIIALKDMLKFLSHKVELEKQ